MTTITPFDFAIFINNQISLIEFQGSQHYKPSSFSNRKPNKSENLEYVQIKDKIKKEYCIKNNIPLLEIPYWEFSKIDLVLESFITDQTILKETCRDFR